MRKQIFTLVLLGMICSVGMSWAADVTLTVSNTEAVSETFTDGSILYSIDSDGRVNAETKFGSSKDIVVSGSKTKGAALVDKRFAIKFPVAVTGVTIYGYNSSSGRTLSKVFTSTTMAKSSYTEITSSTTKNSSSAAPNYNYTFTASWASAISANTAIWFEFNNGCNFYKIVYTPEIVCSSTPNAPTAFAKTAVSSSTATFSITDPADATSYDIYCSESSTTPTSGTSATANVNTKTPTVTGLAANTTYYAWVRSVCDASHKSAWFALSSATFTTLALPNIYYYKDATHYSGGSYKNPEGNTPGGSDGDNTALTTPWTICNSCLAGVTSVIATGAVYDKKGNHMNSYIKLRTNESGKIVFTIASGYKATINIKMGGYSSNPSITMKLNDSGDNITYTGTMSGAATTEDNYAELIYANLAAGAYTLKPTSGSLYISQIDIQTTRVITPAYNKTTYVTTEKLDFTGVDGLKAYVATSASAAGVVMTELAAAVPSGTPLLLIGTASTTYYVPVVSSASAPASNLLEVGDGTTEFDGSTYDYILYSDGLFYQIGSGTVATDKAYLHLDSAPGAAGLRILFEEENATNIESIEATDKAVKFIENGKLYIKKNNIVYDAMGRVIR